MWSRSAEPCSLVWLLAPEAIGVTTMGYELHLTRAEHWADSEDDPISLSEWEDFASGSGDLHDGGWVESEDGSRRRVFSHVHEGVEFSLTWRDGQVDIAGVVGVKAAKSVSWLATAFGAQLVGDDGETY